jgi:hypothetical protein
MALQTYVSNMSVDTPTTSSEGTTIQTVRIRPPPPPPTTIANVTPLVLEPRAPVHSPVTISPNQDQTRSPPTQLPELDYYGAVDFRQPPPPPPSAPVPVATPALTPAPVPAIAPALAPAPATLQHLSPPPPVSGTSSDMMTTTPTQEDIAKTQPILMVTPLSYKDIVSNILYPMPRGRGHHRGMRTRPTRIRGSRGRTPILRLPTEAPPTLSAPSEPATEIPLT